MRTTEERVAAVKRRIAEVNRQKQRRTLFLVAGAALVALVITALIPDKSKEDTK